jgi:hypothetical protein
MSIQVINHSASFGFEVLEQRFFSFTSGLNFYRTGGNSLSSRVNIDYVSFNNTINFNPINKKIKLQLQLGPRLDYILQNSLENTMAARSKFNYGITTGIGAYYQFRKVQLGINAMNFGRQNILFDTQDYKSVNNFGSNWPRIIMDEKFWLLNLSLGVKLNSEE